MKNNYIKGLILGAFVWIPFAGSAQCPTITCPSNISVNNDTGNCGAVVVFTTPAYSDPCATTSQTFSYTGTIDTWTVPPGVTTIHIEARGAQGGFNTSSTVQPGLGASMSGDFTVVPGTQLRILVGQNNNAGNGGGGGTFVTDISNAPLIIAGGGGGSSGGTDSPDKHGQAGTTGGTGAAGGGLGGTAGSGGFVGASGFQSGAGGGLLTDGQDGWSANTGGDAFVNGGAGANIGFGIGGFGGGGNGSGYVVGGGGGGYSGGGGGGNTSAGVGGGGGSFNGGTNQVNSSGVNTGNGSVVITYSNSSSLVLTQVAGLASGSSFPVGSTVQTFIVDDGLGNADTCSFTITVVDAQAPVISCPANIAAVTDSAMCTAVVTFNIPTATDNCSIDTTVQTSGLTSGSAFPIGTTTVTYATYDAAGNSVSCSFDITVTDNQAPVFNCPGTLNVNADSGMCSAVVNYNTPSATDNCNVAAVSMTGGLPSGSIFPIGTTTITYSAIDSSGNMSSCSFDIVVTDAEAPTVVCQGNITVPNDSGNCTAIVVFNTPGATDNCSAASVTQTAGPVSGSAFPSGTTTVVFTATDSAGNTSTCSFDVTVTDSESPSITCPSDVASCTPNIEGIGASASDACSGVATVTYTFSGATSGNGNGDASGTQFNVGTTTVTYDVTDSSGNVSSCSFNVTIHPAPTVTANAASVSPCLNDAPVQLTGTPVGGTWSGTGVTGSTFNPMTAGNGSHIVVYTYVDSNGCTNNATVTINVNACVGITENQSGTINVYPNPTNGPIHIALSTVAENIDVNIVSLSGQVVVQQRYSNTNAVDLELNDLAAGVYFMTIANGQDTLVVKLVRD